MPTVEEVQAVKDAVARLEREHAKAVGAINQMGHSLGAESLSQAEEQIKDLHAKVNEMEARYEQLDGPFWEDYKAATGQDHAGVSEGGPP